MKKITALTVITAALILWALPALAETYPKQVIDKTENWTPKNSPYIIDGTVTVEKKGFITIYPGTVLRFKKGARLLVKGAVYSKGDPKNPVRMIPDDGESFYDGIVLESRYRNTVEFTIIIRGSVISKGSNLIFQNNYILNSTGVELFHFSNALIKDNYFYNDTYGIYAEGREVKFSAVNNTFNNCRFALYLKNLEKPEATIKNNNFFRNTVNLTNYTVNDIDCTGNYWGFTEERYIKQYIYDKKNNQKSGRAVYAPFEKLPLKIWEPTEAFISLVKIYLKLKRPDSEPQRIGLGAGGIAYFPIAPNYVSDFSGFGTGFSAECTFNITGAFLWGIELKYVGLDEQATDSSKYRLDCFNFMLNGYGYIGYKKNLIFAPYIKLSSGPAIVSEQYQDTAGATKKVNQICYTGAAGAGLEWWMLKYFSLKAEATYNITTANRGAIMYPLLTLGANLYFDTPLFADVK
ncbi:MAG: right-handed parallel beta-helix repeat-containing protein [Spirochaetia bacterium]|nr:right-handed parallel beta-helix repeat-containing protein [Spirochaetia bacterium]